MDITPAAESSCEGPGAGGHVTRDARPGRWLTILLFVAATIYAGFLGRNIGAYAGGSDSSGYMNSARVLKSGRVTERERVLPGFTTEGCQSFLYAPLGFWPVAPGLMAPTYPIGLPLLIAGAAVLTDWLKAAHGVMWMHAFAGVGLIYALARRVGFSGGWAALGALLLAVCPVYVQYSLQLMSDVPATAWVLATILCASLSRERMRWAAATGAAFGVAVLVRPSNAVLLLPVAILLGGSARRWLLFVVSGAPLALGFFGFNWRAYGSPLANGYGEIHALFGWTDFGTTLAHYGKWLPALLTPLAWLALALPWRARRDPRWTAALGAWVLAYFGLYACYPQTHETWWYLRFVLPAFPAVILAALLVARDILSRFGERKLRPWGPARVLAAGMILAAGILVHAFRWNRELWTVQAGRAEKFYPDTVEWARAQLPPDAVILTMQMSGALFFSSDFTLVRWDALDEACLARLLQAAAAAKRPVVVLLHTGEEDWFFRQWPRARSWQKAATLGEVTLWRCPTSL